MIISAIHSCESVVEPVFTSLKFFVFKTCKSILSERIPLLSNGADEPIRTIFFK